MNIKLNLKNKFNLLLIWGFLISILLTSLALSNILYQRAEYKLRSEGQILLTIIEELRYYTNKHFLQKFQQQTGNSMEFKPAFVPANAAREVFENFKEEKNFNKYSYKEATINPTNLKDSPDIFEEELIAQFYTNENFKLLSGYTQKDGMKYYYISRPLFVKEESCLQCHSSPALAPKAMLDIYGEQNGFNWKLNQLTSAQTVYIPANNIDMNVSQEMMKLMPIFIVIFALIILAINYLLQNTVINPITQLTKAVKKISLNKFTTTEREHFSYLERLRRRFDESGQLAQAFHSMAKIIANRERDLQQAVEIRTRKLKQEIRDRAIVEYKLERQVKRVLLQEKITQGIRQSLDTTEILQTAVNNIGKALQVSRCQVSIYKSDRPNVCKVVAEYIVPGYSSNLGQDFLLEQTICLKKAISQEKAVYWSYIDRTPLLRPYLHLYEKLQVKSLLAVRTSYQGKVNGAITIHQVERYRNWSQEEIEIMEAVAAQVGIALAQAKLLQEEKTRSQQIELAKKGAEVANQAKSQFLANISHELRTPLNAIIGFSQLMNRDSDLNPKQKETIRIINSSGEHLLEMINEVLEMSKIEAGKAQLNITDVDLRFLIDDLETMLGIKARVKNLQLLVDYSPEIPRYICTDESKLRQVLINLLGNAIKFTETGTVTLRVRHEQTNIDSPHTFLFEVEDTGAGIAPEDISQIFQAFTQSESGWKSLEGTGLGLPISKSFVELMGGKIEVQSTMGQGSIFSFHIICMLSDRDKINLSNTKLVKGIASKSDKRKILAVDDNWQSRLLIVTLLKQIGFEVQEAENGQQAVEIWQEWLPDLIFMDMRMPVMDGYGATKYIKHQLQGHKTKIIALTASAFESKRMATLEAGCDDYLRKPFQENQLFAKIKEHLNIEYIHQENSPDSDRYNFDAAVSNKSEKRLSQLDSTSLQCMPSPWIQEVKQAATELDEVKLANLIKQIPSQHSYLVQPLTDLVDNFQFEKIVQLIN